MSYQQTQTNLHDKLISREHFPATSDRTNEYKPSLMSVECSVHRVIWVLNFKNKGDVHCLYRYRPTDHWEMGTHISSSENVHIHNE